MIQRYTRKKFKSPHEEQVVTDRTAFMIMGKKKKPFSEDGWYIPIFYKRRHAEDYLEGLYPDREDLRVIKVKLHIDHA